MIRGYYTARGWTAEGLIPTEKLRALGLLELVRAEAGTAAGLPECRVAAVTPPTPPRECLADARPRHSPGS
jgi:hypothetical protein